MHQRPPSQTISTPNMVLDLAMLNSALIVLTLNFAVLVALEPTGYVVYAVMLGFDIVVVFLIVPHLVARWLGYDIDALLDPDQAVGPCVHSEQDDHS